MELNKETEKKGFHITITNLDTGETISDTDSRAIIGAIDRGDRVQGIGAVCCNTATLMNVINTADKVLVNCKKEVVKEFLLNMKDGNKDDE